MQRLHALGAILAPHEVQARMSMLSKHFQQAEAILVDQGELDQALAMYE